MWSLYTTVFITWSWGRAEAEGNKNDIAQVAVVLDVRQSACFKTFYGSHISIAITTDPHTDHK